MKSCSHSRLVSVAVSILTLAVTGPAVFSIAQQESLSSNLTQSTDMPQLGDSLTGAEAVVPPGPEPFFPAPTCWAGLRELDRNQDLESFRAALRQALMNDDFLLTAYLRERIAELANTNPQVARDVMASSESAQGDELVTLSAAMERSSGFSTPEVVEQLITTAETHADPQHRIAALQALKTQPSLNATQLDRLTVLGKSEDPIASQAILAIGHVMANDRARAEEYMSRLLDVAQSQKNPAAARLALEMGVDRGISFETASVQRLTDLLLHHPDRYTRQMAGLVLTFARDTDAALRAFQQAFQQEKNFCPRWDMVRFIVTVAGAQALPLLKELAASDPRFQPDYLEYKELYDSGMVDYAEVFWAKKTQHDECEWETIGRDD